MTRDISGELEDRILRSRALQPGADDCRAYVGPPAEYDFMGATQFRLLTGLGLREDHRVVDIGCGSLRAGRFLIPYLMPDRYIGIEPNAWLWQEAFEHELGGDLLRLRRPRFFDDASFGLKDIEDSTADFIIAQSIYSHTATDLFALSMAAAARVLAPRGQFLFTAILPEARGAGNMADGSAKRGWLYPGCLRYAEAEVDRIGAAAGFHLQRLDWFHPRQTWFRAIHDPSMRLTREMLAELGTGRPLFDPRFPKIGPEGGTA